MKAKKTELDVDFIGGQGPAFELTKEEQLKEIIDLVFIFQK